MNKAGYIARSRRAKELPRYVYFLGPDGGPVKIGLTQRPDVRLQKLSLTNAYLLNLWAVIEGTRELEQLYHDRFDAFRLHGEWFSRCSEIEAEIYKIARSQVRFVAWRCTPFDGVRPARTWANG